MVAVVVSGLETLKETFLDWSWPPAVSITRNAVLRTFSALEVGSILIIDQPSGIEHAFGKSSSKDKEADVRNSNTIPNVEIVVKRDSFWLRLFLYADMGLPKATCSMILNLFIVNRQKLNDGMTALSSLSSMLSRLGQSTNTLANSLLNTAAHYDISNDMFAAFLSKDMTYSCPIWQSTRSKAETMETLEDAQQTKLLRFIEGAKLKPSDHVLEIGTGWGSFAIEAVKRTGCQVTSVTLSQNQQQLAEKRIKLAGLGHRIKVLFMDYREIQIPPRPYDKIVSIEMIEAVGETHLAEYFACVHRLLKKDGGIAMFQCITIPEAQHAADANKREFISQHIFPGGYLPSTMELLNHINTQSHGTLTLERVENIGGHYIKTLRLWRENFILKFEEKIKPALLESHPSMSDESVGAFRRKWEYYFSYCEAGFFTKTLGDVIITVGRAGNIELLEGIPH
ncbi:Mycolic acid cyclopropane synthetase-domain-containing protein [Leptodontidium sp. 2 PMI_412]|nr:Mycolic acid cyclopropane synthetase-domain-containing protein [Leptodontidium sp. 2 PMI_412]